jgi:hypothetical protein
VLYDDARYCDVSCAPNNCLPFGSVTMVTAALRLSSRAREPAIVTVAPACSLHAR